MGAEATIVVSTKATKKEPYQQTITQFQRLQETKQNKPGFRNCNRNSHCGCCFKPKVTGG